MSEFDWDKVQTWFERGLDVSPADREAWLTRSIHDNSLRAQVRKLLLADERNSQDQLQTGEPTSPVESLFGRLVDFQQIGPYRILEMIGAGGFGVVFKAVYQSEHPPVADEISPLSTPLFAVKVLSPLATGDAVYARFEREQASLRRVEHPNVAKFIDVGNHQGLPYLVMEYVDGQPLDKLILDRDGKANCQQVPLAQRLSWFRSICDAVAAAHQQLILHRDIKPGNIIIARSGIAVVTDFGLAKSVDTSESSLTFTTTGQLLGTLPFMSPEQVSGKRHLQLSSDVYGLGALLYFLLTSRPPLRAGSLPELSHAICNVIPHPPRHFHADLPKDLDTICMRCLNKSPSRRYSTAEALRDDIDRFLEGLPIVARPVGKLELLHYWVRRRPALAALSSVLLIGGLGSLLVFAWLFTEARHGYNLAEQKNEKLLETIENLSNHIRVAESDPDTLKLQGQMLRTVTSLYDGLAEDPDIDLNTLRKAGVVWIKLGKVEVALGDQPASFQACQRAERYFRRVVDAEQSRAGQASPDDLFDLFHSLASQDKLEQALEVIRQAIRLDTSNEPYFVDAECDILLRLASRYIYSGEFELAEAKHEECTKIAEQLAKDHPENVWFHVKLAQCYFFRAKVSLARQASDKAIDYLEQSAIYSEQALAIDSSIVGIAVEFARTRLQLAALAMVNGRQDTGLEYQRRAMLFKDAELANFPVHQEAWRFRALILQQQMLFDWNFGQREQFPASREAYEQFLRERLESAPDCWLAKTQLAWMISDPSLTAEPDLPQAWQLVQEAHQPSSPHFLDHLTGQILYRMGQWEEALKYFEKRRGWELANYTNMDKVVCETNFYIQAVTEDLAATQADLLRTLETTSAEASSPSDLSINAEFYYQSNAALPHTIKNFTKERDYSRLRRVRQGPGSATE